MSEEGLGRDTAKGLDGFFLSFFLDGFQCKVFIYQCQTLERLVVTEAQLCSAAKTLQTAAVSVGDRRVEDLLKQPLAVY